MAKNADAAAQARFLGLITGGCWPERYADVRSSCRKHFGVRRPTARSDRRTRSGRNCSARAAAWCGVANLWAFGCLNLKLLKLILPLTLRGAVRSRSVGFRRWWGW